MEKHRRRSSFSQEVFVVGPYRLLDGHTEYITPHNPPKCDKILDYDLSRRRLLLLPQLSSSLPSIHLREPASSGGCWEIALHSRILLVASDLDRSYQAPDSANSTPSSDHSRQRERQHSTSVQPNLNLLNGQHKLHTPYCQFQITASLPRNLCASEEIWPLRKGVPPATSPTLESRSTTTTSTTQRHQRHSWSPFTKHDIKARGP
ncbi:hypothetical protein VC83_06654 [Pseudogymnoascus destructans]|uniref:Uncharacterized protein n=1 Tax=Pseudogymnoascus destructans TaxID=655981 RepID=A0A177A2M0_9PEZI|nr:uncharacterized protein VC83_06654 [Pseudogymnoascus destructans]OAF56347.1 hypothetical protein VC83_06654 [Pseudogymnoascus destructans]